MTRWIGIFTLTLALAFTMVACKDGALTTTVTVSRSDIQEKVSAAFPIKKSQNNIQISINNPKVRLDGTKNRLIIDTDILVKLPTVKIGRKGRSITPPALTGKAIVDGDITYDKKAGAVYFAKGNLMELKLDQLPAEYNAKVKSMAASSVESQLKQMEIFKLDESKIEEAAAKQLLQSISVKDDHLEITVGLVSD